jgi:hypothetical protein
MVSSLGEIKAYLQNNKEFFYERFGVKHIGIFGSFLRNEQTELSDIDLVVELEENKKNIHNFLQLKRYLEKDLARKVDLGFEHTLRPVIRDEIKGKLIYV